MKKVSLKCLYNYIDDYLCYGHLEGELELTDEQFKELEKNPEKFYLNEYKLFNSFKIVLDDYDVDLFGSIDKISYKEIK